MPQARRPGRAWWVPLGLGLLALTGAAALAFSPGFRLSPPAAFGEVLSVDLTAGEHAVYVTPSDQWAQITCTGVIPGDSLGLRPDMTLQGVLLPTRWDAQGSFDSPLSGEAHITCDGPVVDGMFTVGPAVGFFELAGAFALGVLGLVLGIVGLIVRAAGLRRR